MTAGTVAAAEQFLILLDDLDGKKPNAATAAVLLTHAATHLRGLLDVIDAHDREVDAEAGLDEVLARVRDDLRAAASRTDLSHLPARAADGERRCSADSPPTAIGDSWACTAAAGHLERWHASHLPDGRLYAYDCPDSAWPVTAGEAGLPNMALVSGALACGNVEGRWTCNAVQGHVPLDHVTFAGLSRSLPLGAVLARWPSVRPESNGHALRPPEWQCARCDDRFPGTKPEDGLCADCAKDVATAAIAQPKHEDIAEDDGPFLRAVQP